MVSTDQIIASNQASFLGFVSSAPALSKAIENLRSDKEEEQAKCRLTKSCLSPIELNFIKFLADEFAVRKKLLSGVSQC